MSKLMTDLPKSAKLFDSAKSAALQEKSTNRLTKTEILLNYEEALKLGHHHDIRKDICREVPAMSLDDIADFHRKRFHDKKQVMLVLGKSGNLNMETLKKYGTVRELTLKDVFGY